MKTLLRRLSVDVRRIGLHRLGRVLLLSSLVGAVAGGGAIVFQLLTRASARLFLGTLAGYAAAGPAGEPGGDTLLTTPFRPFMLPLVVALGGLLTGVLVRRFAPEAGGHGTDEAIGSFHRRDGVIRGRVPIVKTLASAITLGSGGSGGREGPIAQIGAGFGSVLATRLGLPVTERRVLLAAGIGAGVGSIFRAPLAGALFAAEVLYSDTEFESDVVIPAAIASIVAYRVFSLRFGFGALFETPRFEFHSPLELLPYGVLAVVVALGAGAFVRVFYGIHGAFERLRMPRWARPALGGLITGAIGLGLYLATRDRRSLDVLSFGYGSIQQAMFGRVPITLLLLLAAGKLLTTSFSIGSGGSAGVFGPSMVIGGALGGVVGLLAQRVAPGLVTQPGAFVPVGMAGFFAAAANTPISTLVMVSEMTGNYQLLLPALWVCSISYMVGRRWTLYHHQVRSRAESPAHRGTILTEVLRGVRVRDVVGRRPVHTLRETAPIPEVLEAFTTSSQYVFPVVDDEGRMSGTIGLADVRRFLDERDGIAATIAHDLATPFAEPLDPDDDLATALDRMETLELEELPVVDGGGGWRVTGLLSRRDVLAAYGLRRAGGEPRVGGAAAAG